MPGDSCIPGSGGLGDNGPHTANEHLVERELARLAEVVANLCCVFDAASAPVASLGTNRATDADIGLVFMAIKPPQLGGESDCPDRVDAVLGALRQTAGADGAPLGYPGWIEAQTRVDRERRGSPVDREVARDLSATAAAYGVPFAPMPPVA